MSEISTTPFRDGCNVGEREWRFEYEERTKVRTIKEFPDGRIQEEPSEIVEHHGFLGSPHDLVAERPSVRKRLEEGGEVAVTLMETHKIPWNREYFQRHTKGAVGRTIGVTAFAGLGITTALMGLFGGEPWMAVMSVIYAPFVAGCLWGPQAVEVKGVVKQAPSPAEEGSLMFVPKETKGGYCQGETFLIARLGSPPSCPSQSPCPAPSPPVSLTLPEPTASKERVLIEAAAQKPA